MNRRGITVALGLVCLTVLTGCGRKSVPVYPRAEGQAGPSVVPDPQGTARLPKVTPLASTLSVVPTEVTRNPGGPKKPFVLDGLLN